MGKVVLACIAAKVPPVRVRTSDWAQGFAALKTAGDPDGLKGQAEVVALMLGGLPGWPIAE